jgi:dipeptidyl aminopeptidase/acylaminoacyl peptidase
MGFSKITDPARIRQELQNLSPVHQANRKAAPTLLFHGAKDPNVPLQQSETMLAALKKAGVAADLVIKPAEGHGWSDNAEDTARIVDWLNQHLRIKK